MRGSRLSIRFPVAMLVLLSRAAGTGLVAPDLALLAHVRLLVPRTGRCFRLGRLFRGLRIQPLKLLVLELEFSLLGLQLTKGGDVRRGLKLHLGQQVVTTSCLMLSSMAVNISKASRLYSCFGFFWA